MKSLYKGMKNVDKLAEAFLLLKNVEEVKMFLRDLCTLKEIKSMSERLETMKMINDGISYREIAKKTGVSTTTITRVAYWLNHGTGGYKIILKRMKK